MRRGKDLAGQVVVVTGAARGLGALTARRLAARNAQVALLGLERGELARVSAGCGPHSRWWEVDVTDERALADAAAAVRDAYDRIDVVVADTITRSPAGARQRTSADGAVRPGGDGDLSGGGAGVAWGGASGAVSGQGRDGQVPELMRMAGPRVAARGAAGGGRCRAGGCLAAGR